MGSCVFAGSFNPVTNGHLDVIARAARLFDRVTVTVMVNVHKQGVIPLEARVRMLKKVCEPFPNVRVDSWSGLLAEYMRRNGETLLLRGLRSGREFEEEYPNFQVNRRLLEGLETLYLPSDPTLDGIASSTVREIAHFGGDFSWMVPPALLQEITVWLSKESQESEKS